MNTLKRVLLCLLWSGLLAAAPARTRPAAQQAVRIYLPLLSSPVQILEDAPIWTHAGAPAAHEVALFRKWVTLDGPLAEAELHIFADTRYEAWLDGVWLGRGPARFSRSLREFDVLALGDLLPGEHLLAVLVQWAPNIRRSESTTPHLLAHIQGVRSGSLVTLARSGASWQSLASNAWRQDAALVHSWGLIGPTELLEFSQLPENWNQAAFSAQGWQPAVVKDIAHSDFHPLQLPPLDPAEPVHFISPARSAEQPSILDLAAVTYRRRSIPLLAEVPMQPALVDAGALSPGLKPGELVPPYPANPGLNFSLPAPITYTLETLTPFSSTLRLDGAPLLWSAAGPQRPDVITASLHLAGGAHTLSFANPPAGGVTFAASSTGAVYPQFPFQQGLHAGRRLLLANPQHDLTRVRVLNTQPLSLVFQPGQNYAVLDLGRTVYGRLKGTVSGPQGTVLDIGWDERLSASGRPLPYPGSLHPEWNQVDSWVLDGKERSLTTLDARAGRFILIAVWASQPVSLSDLQVYEERLPVSLQGSFSSSDPLLDQVWQVGVQSLYPNLSDAYTDTPWRERGQWWGDAYAAEQAQRVAFGDFALLRRSLEFMADAFSQSAAPGAAPNPNGTHMLDYSMLWVQALAEYYADHADPHLLDRLYPQVRAFLQHLATYEDPATGLLDLPPDHWSQTVYIESFGQASRVGESTAANAMYYGTLQQAAGLADHQGDAASAQAWQQKAARAFESANQILYQTAGQRYLSSLTQGLPSPPTPQAQAWALAYGLVPLERQQGVASALLDLLSEDPTQPNLDVYGMYWVLRALGESGHIPEALALIENYYGYMLTGGATTWWEKFDAGQKYNASLSHSWGGSPTWFLTTYVLGAQRRGEHGWRVRPALSGLESASGALPLGEGVLQVSWERPSCQQGSVEIDSPQQSTGEAVLPLDAAGLQVSLDGELIWDGGSAAIPGVISAPDGLHIPLPGGSHRLEFSQECASSE